MRIIPEADYIVAVYVPEYQRTESTSDGGIVLPNMHTAEPVSIFKVVESTAFNGYNLGQHILVKDCDATIMFDNKYLIHKLDILGRIEER
jgi:hypothetical protein